MQSEHQGVFPRLATWSAVAAGRPIATIGAVLLVVLWAISGAILGPTDTWQLTMNTISSIVTFVMVFLIQSSQNRDGQATQLKLDELIRSMAGAQNAVMDLEHLDPVRLDRFSEQYRDLARRARDAADDDTKSGRPPAPEG